MLAGEYSINAKLLYGLLLNRTTLSQKSGWVSEDGNVYVIYTIKQMANDLDRSERTVKTALRELENAGLITRVGADHFGRFIVEELEREGVSTRGVRSDPDRLILHQGTPEDWPAHLDRLIAEKGVTDIVLYGDVRPVHAAARAAAKARGLTLPEAEAFLEIFYPPKAQPAGRRTCVSKRQDWRQWKKQHGRS